MKIGSLPTTYTPYTSLTICSNEMVNGKVLFSFSGSVPILVGAGSTPQIWLSSPADKEGSKWLPLVTQNKSLHPAIRVLEEGKLVRIFADNAPVISVRETADDAAIIDLIDLRPFGINIYGDEHSLHVATNTLSNNHFQGVQAMIGIGDNNPPEPEHEISMT